MTTALAFLDLLEQAVQGAATIAASDSVSTTNNVLQQSEAGGRWAAYQDVAEQIAKAKREGLLSVSAIEEHANQLRERILHVATLYKETADIIQVTSAQIPPERAAQFVLPLGILQITYAALWGFASVALPEDFEQLDKLLANVELMVSQIKELAIAVPPKSGLQ